MGLFGGYDDFDDLFSGLFNRFNRPVLDQKYFDVYKKENKGYVVIFNALGIRKEDMSVRIEKPKGQRFKNLHVKGTTDIAEYGIHNSIDMAVKLNFEEEIKSVSYKLADGLLYVFLEVELPKEENNKIEAKLIDNDSDSLDW